MDIRHTYDSKLPYAIRVVLHSEWYIEEVGQWPNVINKFPDLHLTIGQPAQPMQAFYIHSMTQNSKIKDVEVVPNLTLRIQFDNGYTIIAPSMDEYVEYPWIIDSDDDPMFPNFYFCLDGEEMIIYSKLDS
ncbi:hypothetical protein KK062_10895 [Fulvivirgaceae bacterium PWU5]|uniref:Uncharacterized protein n=1 Tax=Dawidia cretensis TaxID=2782350 RepID=A0AAP2GUD6_9BACT|nr:hypothetical protein [Dawidia cretensis]MBT1708735.1 hypothetical protein [Dawidia cretensis]